MQHAQRNRRRDYLLSGGRLTCTCGHTMSGAYHGQKDFRSYRCAHPRHLPGERCRGFVAAHTIEAQTWQAVARALRQPELIAQEVI